MFYTAASAALCAPKSKWSTNIQVAEWELHIGPFHDERQAAACAAQCRGWRRRIEDARIPSVEKVHHRATWVKIKGDITFLVRSGIQCQWGEATRPSLRQASSLEQHLRDWTAGIGLEEVQMKVCCEPLYIVDPKSGEKGYLEYVPPNRPIKYLGYLICADLNWRPALEAVHAKLDKLLRQVRRGKQLGLPRDLFLQACNSKIGGMLGYYLVGIPTSEGEMTNINNKVAQACTPSKALSVHQLRMLPPVGLGVMDVELDIAQRRIKMATDTLHSNDVEGSALRWCLRVLQLVHQVPHFWWSDPRVARTGTNRGFVEGVTQSLKVMELAILCTTGWFDRPPADSTLWERGFKPDTPERDMLLIAKRARTHRVYTLMELESKRHLFRDFEEHRDHQAREHVLPTNPGPLFTLVRKRLTEPVNLPPDTSMSDGSGQPHTTAAQVDGIDHVGSTQTTARLDGYSARTVWQWRGSSWALPCRCSASRTTGSTKALPFRTAKVRSGKSTKREWWTFTPSDTRSNTARYSGTTSGHGSTRRTPSPLLGSWGTQRIVKRTLQCKIYRRRSL